MTGKAPDTPCAGGCGKLVYRTSTSAANPVCRDCRRARLEAAPPCSRCAGLMTYQWRRSWINGKFRSAPPVCGPCRTALRTADELACLACGETKPRDEFRSDARYAAGTGIRSRRCRACEGQEPVASSTERKRQYVRARRRARKGAGKTYDGVTDEQIYERDNWRCRMPECLHPAGRTIDPELGCWPWRRSIDHVIPLSRGGPDSQDNKRAAHLQCNVARGAKTPLMR